MAIQLDQLIPQQVEFKLFINGDEQTLRIGPFTARHEIWLKQTFGSNLENVFKDLDGANLARIAFHVLHPEDRIYFGKRVCKTVDEDGNEFEESIGGYQLLADCIKGPSEKLRLLTALTQSIGVSRALVDELEDEEKKKAEQVIQSQSKQ